MKTIILLMFTLTICEVCVIAQNKLITGKVLDVKSNPISYANIYIESSMEGASSSENGEFKFETSKNGIVKLIVSMIGYESYLLEDDISKMNNLTIVLKETPLNLNEVLVQVGSFVLKGTSSIDKKGSIDVATTAGSEGDLFKAISLLPGAQVTGTDGRLLIRGGSSSESQTYIDDMHVLSPYGASAPNHQARSRYSPFFFSGVNFSMGGFSPEYSQSLSSVLPLYTRDEANDSKVGVNLMNVSLGGGGTQAWDKSSLSLNFDYGNLDWYNKMFYPNQKRIWNKSVQFYSVQKQFRYTPKENMYFKTYYTFDKATYSQNHASAFSDVRKLDFDENNIYLNSTFRNRTKSGLNYFAGVAYAWNEKTILGAKIANDKLKEIESELHVKIKGTKRFSNFYKLELGTESFLKNYRLNYESTYKIYPRLNHNISGLYVSNDFNIAQNVLLNASLRGEYTSLNTSFTVLSRIAVSYNLNDFILSGVVGRYQQLSHNEYLAYNKKLSNERNWQYQIGLYYQKNHKIFRAEVYYKDYENLPTKVNDLFQSVGYGYSRGVDLYFNDQLFFNHLDYTVSYTFNDSKRKYLNYPYKVQPPYVTKYNASLSIRYMNLTALRSVIAITNRIASGRPYNTPNEEVLMNGRTSVFYTTDISWTILAHKNLIIYASASNIFNRKNIYGYDYKTQPNNMAMYERKPIKLEQSQAFYIGFFLTLGKNAAYETTHF